MMAYAVSREAMLLYAFFLDQCDELGVVESIYGMAFHSALDKDEIDKAVQELTDGGYIETFTYPAKIAEHPGHWVAMGTGEGCQISGYISTTRHSRLSAAAWAELRSQVFERDNYTCVYCGERGGTLECDHIIPIAAGGTNELGNLVTACAPCNKAKRAKVIDGLREVMAVP